MIAQSPVHLRMSQAVREALAAGDAVVALESTVIAHGLPYPTNLECAMEMESVVRRSGAVPATIALLGGELRVGLKDSELEYLATARGIHKVSRRNIPIVVAQGHDGATTVAATATIASWAGISIFATGGIGGVHRGAFFDISNDLPTLASVPVTVVCAGAKSILDLRATLEWLETHGVPVIGYGTDEFPAFYTQRSGLPVDVRVESPHQAAAIVAASRNLGLRCGTLITVPVPSSAEVSSESLDAAIASGLVQAEARGIRGGATTPFLLGWLAEQTGGATLNANVALLKNNARVAAQIAAALRERD